MSNISNLFAAKMGYPNLFEELSEKIPASELNTLLLELFRTRAKKVKPAELLRQFEKNRFASPSEVDTINFKEFELRCLKLAKGKGFLPITLSPLAPFGTCSSVAFVDQNKLNQLISYRADPSNFDKEMTTMEHIIRSYKIIE